VTTVPVRFSFPRSSRGSSRESVPTARSANRAHLVRLCQRLDFLR
jgi:hypothetical protein